MHEEGVGDFIDHFNCFGCAMDCNPCLDIIYIYMIFIIRLHKTVVFSVTFRSSISVEMLLQGGILAVSDLQYQGEHLF